jgi:exopolysaccharide biosynthesis WecB/TagA/CpsF family protein
MLKSIRLLDVPVAMISPEEALAEIERLYLEDIPATVAYVNAHTLNLATSDIEYRRVLQEADLVLNDGAGVAMAARLQGRRFPANLNGSDFNPRIVRLASERGWPVFFLGGRPGVARSAAERLQGRFNRLNVAGYRDGYFEDESAVVDEIKRSGAGLLMVALGNPKQELFLARHLSATGARLGVGVGAFFDFTAGAVPRAPQWMNRAGIEWIYRLAQEPGRMWRRYLIGNPVFLARSIREAVRNRRN